MITQGERVKSAALWAGRRRATTDHTATATTESENDTAQLGVSNCWSEKERESEGATICRWRCWWWPGDFKQYTAVYTAHCIHGAELHSSITASLWTGREKGFPSVRQSDVGRWYTNQRRALGSEDTTARWSPQSPSPPPSDACHCLSLSHKAAARG